MFQSNLDLPLNTKSAHNYVTEFWEILVPWFLCYEFLFIPARFFGLTNVDIVSMSNA
jgi:hypothetical protein